jgi:hypothetical protein
MGRDGNECPYCGVGRFVPTGESAEGYPLEECNFCNAFSLCPVPGREPPMRRVLRALHNVGIEAGKLPTPPEEIKRSV